MSKNFESKYRIYYEDTDAGGIVYYANYLKFFERARTEMLRESNISQMELIDTHNLIFVVRNCNIEYKKGAKLDDLVTIKTNISEMRSASIIMHQEMFLKDELINVLDVKIACITADGKKPSKIPSEIKNKLNV
jgi:acyl-CoA thioester hydrolase